MIKVENINVWGWEHAIRGMRNPMNSWEKSDSYICDAEHCRQCPIPVGKRNCNQPDGYIIGANDLSLMQKLYKAGTEHRKFMRQIFISMDVVAPLYWWKELDQYKIGVVTDSCSTMHKIHSKKFEFDDFSHEKITSLHSKRLMKDAIMELNILRDEYNRTKSKDVWYQMIQLLPSSYDQRRTLTMNYEVAATIIRQRTGHKLDEWNQFVKVLKGLPYMAEIMGGETE